MRDVIIQETIRDAPVIIYSIRMFIRWTHNYMYSELCFCSGITCLQKITRKKTTTEKANLKTDPKFWPETRVWTTKRRWSFLTKMFCCRLLLFLGKFRICFFFVELSTDVTSAVQSKYIGKASKGAFCCLCGDMWQSVLILSVPLTYLQEYKNVCVTIRAACFARPIARACVSGIRLPWMQRAEPSREQRKIGPALNRWSATHARTLASSVWSPCHHPVCLRGCERLYAAPSSHSLEFVSARWALDHLHSCWLWSWYRSAVQSYCWRDCCLWVLPPGWSKWQTALCRSRHHSCIAPSYSFSLKAGLSWTETTLLPPICRQSAKDKKWLDIFGPIFGWGKCCNVVELFILSAWLPSCSETRPRISSLRRQVLMVDWPPRCFRESENGLFWMAKTAEQLWPSHRNLLDQNELHPRTPLVWAFVFLTATSVKRMASEFVTVNQPPVRRPWPCTAVLLCNDEAHLPRATNGEPSCLSHCNAKRSPPATTGW